MEEISKYFETFIKFFTSWFMPAALLVIVGLVFVCMNIFGKKKNKKEK